MASEMIERVADVLLNAGCGDTDECLRIARAAIEAMREPTGAMIAASRPPSHYLTSDTAWRAMIDAALK